MNMGDALVYIAAKLGIATQQIFEIYKHGVVVERMLGVVFFLFVVISVIGYTKWWWKYSQKLDDSDGFFVMTIYIFGLVVIIAGADMLYHAVLAYMVPDYVALKEMLQSLGGVSG